MISYYVHIPLFSFNLKEDVEKTVEGHKKQKAASIFFTSSGKNPYCSSQSFYNMDIFFESFNKK